MKDRTEIKGSRDQKTKQLNPNNPRWQKLL